MASYVTTCCAYSSFFEGFSIQPSLSSVQVYIFQTNFNYRKKAVSLIHTDSALEPFMIFTITYLLFIGLNFRILVLNALRDILFPFCQQLVAATHQLQIVKWKWYWDKWNHFKPNLNWTAQYWLTKDILQNYNMTLKMHK